MFNYHIHLIIIIVIVIFLIILYSYYNLNLFSFHYKKEILIIVISCPKDFKTINLNISQLPYDSKVLMCNKLTNSYDANEAGIMLDYIINNYYIMKYDKLLFIHDHDRSVHYPTSITKRINEISKNIKLYNKEFIGVNCNYIQFNVGNNYEGVFHEVEPVDKYLSEKGIDHIKMSEIHENKYIFPCCATFILSTKLIKLHSQDYYFNLRKTLKKFSIYGFNKFVSKEYLDSKYRNKMAGGYMEFTWSTMFGQKNVSFPPDCVLNEKK